MRGFSEITNLIKDKFLHIEILYYLSCNNDISVQDLNLNLNTLIEVEWVD